MKINVNKKHSNSVTNQMQMSEAELNFNEKRALLVAENENINQKIGKRKKETNIKLELGK